ncbi:MAG TPA: bifunctional phosphoribosylaminoimidazolecarboxamide formyltransferase/IMP cyclohydrolase [Mycobacteriales bacterium]|jgi:phosphoribosylaminoimidazolecarboxamide formyltransferase/IMP cyclohydrolase|nr:bifunctional phosphoribosylaminoimidazolecarboxamide formyltransferase/IMP cyclohydrolase [Mycobacteriales bacterium]
MSANSVNRTETAPNGSIPFKRALISVYDKTGLAELVTALAALDVEIVSTGSTAKRIAELGVKVTPVSEVTGFAECLDGRVKTLHPHIHAGILADRSNPKHVDALDQLGIAPFDLVVVNLYPFAATIAAMQAEGLVDPGRAIEQIDIGGPTMIRAAAKNHGSVAVVVDPTDYAAVAAAANGFDLDARHRLAAKAFAHTARYDAAVASWFCRGTADGDEQMWPPFVGVTLERAEVLRYGENPHQEAALYVSTDDASPGGVLGIGIAQAEQLHGKPMSYNNYVDADAAYRAAYDFAQPAVAIIKHTNPCGIAVTVEGSDIAEAHRNAHACDPVSAYGGVIATNRSVTVAMAEQVAKIFTEVIVAPSYEEGAVELLSVRPSIRVLTAPPRQDNCSDARVISGGVLAQCLDTIDTPGDNPANWQLVCGEPAAPEVLADAAFAWRTLRAVKSNAIVLASGQATVGIGMGQVNRVDSARLAVARSGDRAAGAVGASDAYFPFPDGLQVLADAGVKVVVQPGGSIRDETVIEAAKESGVTMYFTGTRHFAH